MNYIQAVFLGFVQGITEFLPISSSGHLVIAQKLLNFQSPPVFFDVFIHFATLTAVIIFFRKNLLSLNKNTISAIILATIPTGIIGLFLNPLTNTLFNSILVVSLGLILSTIILFSLHFLPSPKNKNNISIKTALIIGLAQGLAIIPGVSRSGATIVTGLWLGLSQTTAFSFSFILSIPAILAAQVLQLSDLSASSNIGFTTYLLGFITAAFSGFICLKLLKNILINNKLKNFGFYTFLLSLASILLASRFLN